MKCTLDGKNARVLAKAIQSLAKFGADLFVEADNEALQLRSLNTTQSAVGTFRFNRTFFETYNVQEGDENYCKLSMKACLNVFRNMKQVEHCELHIIADTLKFQIKFKCRLETLKNALLSIIDEENMNAAVLTDSTPNVIVGTHKLFTEISSNFNAAEEEITLEVNEQQLTAKNYIEGSRVNDKFMRSKLKIAGSEFESYKITHEAAITFCLKEFRAFLSFAEAVNEVMVLNFDEAGSPIFIKINKHDQVECILIMSTLAPDDISFYENCRPTDVTMNECITKPATKTRETTKRKIKNTNNNAPKRIAEASTISSTNTSLFQFRDEVHHDEQTKNSTPSITVARNLANNDIIMIEEPAPVLPIAPPTVVAAAQLPQTDVSIAFCETEEDQLPVGDVEYIGKSPQHPKSVLRKIFSRCFEATYVQKEPSPSSQVFVPDSDAED